MEFKRFCLHQLPDRQGWYVIGIRFDDTRQVIIELGPRITRKTAERRGRELARAHAENPELGPDE